MIHQATSQFEVTIRKVETAPIRAYADVVINKSYCVTGIKIIEGVNGLFISMPQRKRNGAFKDVFFPINAQARAELVDAILEAYHQS